jgi:hypothetical protein
MASYNAAIHFSSLSGASGMKTCSFFIALAIAAVALLSLPQALLAEDAADAAEQKIQQLMQESLDWYTLLPKAGRTPLRPQVVLRWRNAARAERGEQAKDLLVLWAYQGRPVAAASVFPWDGKLCYELGLLSRETGLVARDDQAVVWSPRTAGLEFRDVPEAPEPADSAPLRLRQMKAIAERFTATLIGWKANDSGPEELRLLPRPLYRYELDKASPAPADLRDGAVLAFVQGTDPELLLLLEAVVIDKRPQWQYALSRSTSGGLEAKLDEKVIWQAEELADTDSPTNPHLVLRRKLKE